MPKSLLRAKVQYLATADGGKATYYASEAGVDHAQAHDGQFRYCEVEIHNGRNNPNWNVDKEGFQLLADQSTSVTDFQNEEQVTSVFYKEVEEILLKHIKGATRVEIFDHTRRASTAALRQRLQCREPSAIVHNDYTGKSATKRLYDMLPEEAPSLSQKRFAIVNLWRSIAGTTVQSSPLAFCDSTSMNVHQELISVKRVAKNRIGELQMALYSPDHKWYYFPQLLTAKEVLIFKTFDSCADKNQFTIHTALDGVGDVSVPRQSIEIRAFVFFD
ncbi:expressed unknown protein [Seminavis robusta]|uniref:Methyltransferase n=1 Tax=Seminavis robusta TaxID=568900 RepID=A0A9N8DTU9_9STRA|nr:expressed unknown protein [Seminavis robusta]|eukprot:Sro286_g108200.1 n/a (274) ;mRNA; r:2246-3067